jgi:hypothetical protein
MERREQGCRPNSASGFKPLPQLWEHRCFSFVRLLITPLFPRPKCNYPPFEIDVAPPQARGILNPKTAVVAD